MKINELNVYSISIFSISSHVQNIYICRTKIDSEGLKCTMFYGQTGLVGFDIYVLNLIYSVVKIIFIHYF